MNMLIINNAQSHICSGRRTAAYGVRIRLHMESIADAKQNILSNVALQHGHRDGHRCGESESPWRSRSDCNDNHDHGHV